MIYFILGILISGFFVFNILNDNYIKKTFLNIFSFSFCFGIVYHTLISFLLVGFKIYYSKIFFIISSLLIILINLFLKKYRKRLVEYKIDRDRVPIYFILFIVFFLVRLITLVSTSYVNYYHWDEMGFYQYITKALYLTHDTSYYFKLFVPINTFIGTMCHEFGGLSLVLPRVFNSICFVVVAMFIYSFIRNHNVNRHIAALSALIFLISSGEALYVYKTFYSNIYYTLFILPGAYLVCKHYFIDRKSDIPIIGYFFLLGAFFARREGMYHIVPFLFIVHLVILLRNKKFNIKIFIPEMLYVLFFAYFVLLEKFGSSASTVILTGASTTSIILEKLKWANLTSFFHNVYISCFSTNLHYLNYLLSFVTVLAVLVFIYYFFRKSKRNSYFDFYKMIMLLEFIYFGIVVATVFFLFTVNEMKIAASFSRYMMTVVPINFVVLPVVLFHDTIFDEKGKRSEVSMGKKLRTLLIIPAYNEQDNILDTYNTIQEYNKKHKTEYDVIVINDGSSDNTLAVCRENNIPVVSLIQNIGIGGAVQTGYKYALLNNYDIAVQYDGDGQHDISYVDDLIKELKTGKSDIVIGSRFTGRLDSFKSTRLRRFGISIISKLIRITTGVKVTDPTSGFRAVNKNVIAHFANTYPKEFPEPESIVTLIRRGFVVKEVPVKMKERVAGVSSIRMWKSAYYMISVCFAIIVTSIKRVGDC